MRRITFASQQNTPWTGFNGFRGFGQGADTATMMDDTVATVVYDSAGNVAGFVGPASAAGTNSYDANGNLIATTAPTPAGASNIFTSITSWISGLFGQTNYGAGSPTGSMFPQQWSGLGPLLLIGAGVYVLASMTAGSGSRRRR